MQLDMFFQHLALALIKQSVPFDRVSRFLETSVSRIDSNVLDYSYACDLISLFFPNMLPITLKDWDDAKWVYERNVTADVAMLCVSEVGYPRYLKSTTDAPPIIFIKGDADIFSSLPGVAIVGAREASANGKEIARRIAKFMVENGWPVVSGLALGIDAAAHRGALDGHGKTIAVLAGGLDKASPAANAGLGIEILEAGGAWISEHPVGTPPKKHHFVPRNRIQVGLSAGSILVEAKIKSGSLTQARFCIGQNRPLFAVIPNDAENSLGLNSEGTLHMVNDLGAVPIRTRNDYEMVVQMLSEEKNRIE